MGWGEAQGPAERLQSSIERDDREDRASTPPAGSKLGDLRRELEVVTEQREELLSAARLVVSSLDHIGVSASLAPGAAEAFARLRVLVESTPTNRVRVSIGEWHDGERVIFG